VIVTAFFLRLAAGFGIGLGLDAPGHRLAEGAQEFPQALDGDPTRKIGTNTSRSNN